MPNIHTCIPRLPFLTHLMLMRLPCQRHSNVLTSTHAHVFTKVAHTRTHTHTHTHKEPHTTTHTTTHNHQDKHYRPAAAPTDALHTIPRPPPHRRTLPRSGQLRKDSPQPLPVGRLKLLPQVLWGDEWDTSGEGIRLLCACNCTKHLCLLT